jgi:uncharacterized protein
MSHEQVLIPCGPITLEGVLETPRAAPGPAALVCHPHPLYGGAMNNNVVLALAQTFSARGMACLRFNFRGTGNSQGIYSGGELETEDVKSALDFLLKREEVKPDRVVLAGYSFGCWVALRAAATDRRPSRLIGISPPVNEYDFGFMTAETRPILLVAGDRDFVCSVDKFEELAAQIPGPKSAITLPGADHFHFGRDKQLAGLTVEFLDRFPWEDGA